MALERTPLWRAAGRQRRPRAPATRHGHARRCARHAGRARHVGARAAPAQERGLRSAGCARLDRAAHRRAAADRRRAPRERAPCDRHHHQPRQRASAAVASPRRALDRRVRRDRVCRRRAAEEAAPDGLRRRAGASRAGATRSARHRGLAERLGRRTCRGHAALVTHSAYFKSFDTRHALAWTADLDSPPTVGATLPALPAAPRVEWAWLCAVHASWHRMQTPAASRQSAY
jgi:hypothetical protein